ncbi:MAG: hypothetical protein KF789_07885 [Bdellovibrionaceae bacterium]|nr:hypothetical protein [Pseudobdellovibrionaceae bacterium]
MKKSNRFLTALIIGSALMLGACSHKEKQDEQPLNQESTLETATEPAVAAEVEKPAPVKKAKKKSSRKASKGTKKVSQ